MYQRFDKIILFMENIKEDWQIKLSVGGKTWLKNQRGMRYHHHYLL